MTSLPRFVRALPLRRAGGTRERAKDKLEALAQRARRSKSFLAAEAIAAYVEVERWQLDEIEAGLQERDKGRAVAHKDVTKWLRSWSKKPERKAPRA